MICNKCGKENSNTNRHCINCGNQLIFEQINPNYQNITNNKSNKWIFVTLGCLIGIPVLILCATFSFVFVATLVKNFNDPFVGNWNCSSYEDLNNYSINMNFSDSNSEFVISKSSDDKNNYISGEYDYEKFEDKEENISYYELELDVDTYTVNGKSQNNNLDEFIVEFSKDKKQMIIADSRGYNQYYCIKK